MHISSLYNLVEKGFSEDTHGRGSGIGMSIFDDDFYSTKISAKVGYDRHWGLEDGWYGRPTQRLWLIIVASAALGALLMLMIIGPRLSTGDRVVQAADRVKPAVVSVVSFVRDANGASGRIGMGSGVIFDKRNGKASIITNHHVIDGASQVDVVLSGGERKNATVVGKDPLSDLAVLEVDASGIQHVAKFGNSDRLRAGETAIAVGNPLGLGYSPTITVGVVSSPKRTIPISLVRNGEPDWEIEVIQTDAAINQGNSGGALVDLRGRVIGISSMKVADAGVEGLGFAIPINQVKPVIESLRTHHKVQRPYMGVTSQNLQSFKGSEILKLPPEAKAGVVVLDASGPATDAGLKKYDVIVQLDDQPISSTLELRKYLYSKKKIGEKMKVTYYRGGNKETATLTLGEAD
jgi:serine protease Do